MTWEILNPDTYLTESQPFWEGKKCEWCDEPSYTTKLVSIIDSDFLCVLNEDDKTKSFYENPFNACIRCREKVGPLMGLKYVEENNPSIESRHPLLDEIDNELLRRFINLKEIFKSLVSDIYLIPDSELASDNAFKGKLNVVVAFRGLTLLGYIRWATRERKSILHLWNDKEKRDKFWVPGLFRIILALGTLNAQSERLSIWIKSYSRIISIDTLCQTPPEMIQIRPKTLLKLTE